MGLTWSKENKVNIDGQTYYGGLNQPNHKFVKVNVDCWEKIFDFLSLSDILAMSQTCQRMRQIGGHYFRENYHGTKCELSGPSDLEIYVGGNPMERVDFLRFVDTINVHDELEYLRTVSSMYALQSLTTLCLHRFNLNRQQLRGLDSIQPNIETIFLNECCIGDNSVGEFFASCPKLKCLRFTDVDFKSEAIQANFFQRTYPMIESFQCVGIDDAAQFISFLERNPNIKCLRCETDDLEEIPLDTLTVKLDCLDIRIWREVDSNQLLNQLKALHGNEFFKKLRLSIDFEPDGFDGEMFFREIISFNALEMLKAAYFHTNSMNHLAQLKELHLRFLSRNINLDTMAVNLNNLERLQIDGTGRQLLPFLRHSKKLKFVIFHPHNGSINYNAFNLSHLNKIRMMAEMQHKLSIGLQESDYLKTKWMAKNVNYDLVEFTREESIRKHFDNNI